MLLLTLLAGCMTFSRVNGAKTLEPGQMEGGVVLGVRTADDPSFPIPIPQGPVMIRAGIVENLDMGARLYLLGAGMDLRYRFYHEGKWHLAVNPGIGAILQPSLINPTDLGGIEISSPLLAEVELTPWFSVASGLGVIYRDRLNLSFDGRTTWRHDVYGGGGLRFELHKGITVVGLSGDVYGAPTRHTGAPVFAAALDLKLRMLTKAQEQAKKERKAAKKKGKR